MSEDVRRKTFDAVVKAVRDRVLRFVISTGSRDRDGDTIDPDGWELANFRKNPVVLFAHEHRDLPIAKALDVRVERSQLIADAEFVPAEIYPFAETVFRMLREGYLRATSVGFKALKWARRDDGGVDFQEQELLEFSVCSVPANADALMVGRGADAARVKSWFARSQGDGDDLSIEITDDDTIEVDDDLAREGRAAHARQRMNSAELAGLIDVDRAQLRAIAREVVAAAMPHVVAEAVRAELRRRRGRLD
jgi:HK97 family phage prohead protease